MNRFTLPKFYIPYISEPLLSDNQGLGLAIKENGKAIQIDKINWIDYSFQPLVKLYAAYSDTSLWLFYEVQGDFFRGKAMLDQEAVWEDSCVEFFITTELEKYETEHSTDEISYRNFEFNALGVCLSASGTKTQRELLSPDEMSRILRVPGLQPENIPEEGSMFDWELCVAIPLDMLGLHPGSSFRANFYKCGDLTRQPHFLSWNSITSTDPDFHLPRFFGELELVSD